MRLFVAIELPEPVREALARLERRLERTDERRRVRWVRPENLHATIKFLGEIEENQLEALEGALAASVRDVSPFALEVGGLALLPPNGRPRVVYVGLEPRAPLEALARAVEAASAAFGVEPEGRRFLPHITIGRVRGGRGRRRGDALCKGLRAAIEQKAHERFSHEPFELRALSLIESELGREGPRYTRIARLPFGGG